MFGDPATNPYNWDKINISEVVGDKVSNGFFAKRDDYADDGNVSVMGVAYIVNRMYSQWQDLPRTNGTDKDIEKFEVKYGDMLFLQIITGSRRNWQGLNCSRGCSSKHTV